ncbi:hypothetical protein AYI68_g7281, partial [Smittium mucronatum]
MISGASQADAAILVVDSTVAGSQVACCGSQQDGEVAVVERTVRRNQNEASTIPSDVWVCKERCA